MGNFDNADQYFDSPDVSSGYSGMDSSGGDYWSGFDFNAGNSDTSYADSVTNNSFWDTGNTWDNSYDAVFATQPDFSPEASGIMTSEDYNSALGDSSGGGLLGDIGGFLKTPTGMGMLVGGLGQGLNYLGRRSLEKNSKSDSDARIKAAERLKQMEIDHAERMQRERIAAEAEAQKNAWHPREKQPGRADNTTSNLAAHLVK